MKTVLVTGGAGFIGSALVRSLAADPELRIVVMDHLGYSSNPESVAGLQNVVLKQVDIADAKQVQTVFEMYKFKAIYHLAAESHVDRSLDSPEAFIRSNVIGTFNLLESFRQQCSSMELEQAKKVRFLHVSTDEVFGSLGATGYFSETTAYDPKSPYSASKAASDHLARAWFSSYDLPIVISNCSNNYGPRQHPEKLIPLTITRALSGKSLPIYGSGVAIRDWLHVDDHAAALRAIMDRGKVGESYNIGTNNELDTKQVVGAICDLLDQLVPKPSGKLYQEQIEFVEDRRGHDMRYAIDATKILRDLAWRPSVKFDAGLRDTVKWYIDNPTWTDFFLSKTEANARQGVVK